MNKQREVIYHRRRETLGGEDLKEEVVEMIDGLAAIVVDTAVDRGTSAASWDWDAVSRRDRRPLRRALRAVRGRSQTCRRRRSCRS